VCLDLSVVVWIKEFLLGRSQRVREDGHLSDDVRVTSGVPGLECSFVDKGHSFRTFTDS
jgi:hypothetical protein